MLFNSYQFLFVFFPIVIVGFFLFGRWHRLAAAYWLVLSSLVFYGWWNIKVLPLLLISVGLNFFLGKRITAAEHDQDVQRSRKKLWLIGAVSANLLLLAFFKYANFLVGNLSFLTTAMGGQALAAINIILPIGISFYTFTQIAFLVDCWQGKVREAHLAHYVLFVTYFPHLIAGPVLHHSEMMPQFRRADTYRPNYNMIALGLSIFIIGLAKKLLIADPLSGPAGDFFEGLVVDPKPTFWSAWIGILCYTFQIYFDFSGYSDMAIGISLCFGIRLPINFNSPYKATSIIEFWRCWHMSLSRFLRDYLYFPLGGNRNGLTKRYANLLVTMVLGGLWHGAQWTFVLWGFAHGVLLAWNHVWRYLMGEVLACWFRPACWFLTFVSICFTWVLFRADSVTTAVAIYGGLLGQNGTGAWEIAPRLLALLITSFVIVLVGRNSQQMFEYSSLSGDQSNELPSVQWPKSLVFLMGTTLFLCLLRIGVPSPFLYFQF